MKYALKHLQSLVAVALCVVMAMAFTSCSDDDDETSEEYTGPQVLSINGETWSDDEISGVLSSFSWTPTLPGSEGSYRDAVGFDVCLSKDGKITDFSFVVPKVQLKNGGNITPGDIYIRNDYTDIFGRGFAYQLSGEATCISAGKNKITVQFDNCTYSLEDPYGDNPQHREKVDINGIFTCSE